MNSACRLSYLTVLCNNDNNNNRTTLKCPGHLLSTSESFFYFYANASQGVMSGYNTNPMNKKLGILSQNS